ncbi:hypothetical protein JOB18_024190 [Solea senegalensis]|uniref:Uncharacterized protein n=1 Tax=Solea senegalensis TaxID=28829 RepID=A0AAV6PZC8_SOLSE|nr:hypothetical protein JOB18_024190 [Solea senegalensis]
MNLNPTQYFKVIFPNNPDIALRTFCIFSRKTPEFTTVFGTEIVRLKCCITTAEATPERAVNNNKGPKQTTTQEMDCAPENHNESPLKKKRPHTAPSSLESSDFFESISADASKEVSLLLSQFAEGLSVSAAADKAQMKQMEGILTEARNLESFLKEKKKCLRQALDVISDKLKD